MFPFPQLLLYLPHHPTQRHVLASVAASPLFLVSSLLSSSPAPQIKTKQKSSWVCVHTCAHKVFKFLNASSI